MPEVDPTPSVYAIGMRERFRGITERQGMVWPGPAGWAEWSPFLDYDDAVAVDWLAAADEAAELGWPAPVRDRVPVNATVPAVAATAVPGVLARYDGCEVVKVKVRAMETGML